MVFSLPGLETKRRATRRKPFVVSVWLSRRTLGNTTNFATHLEHHHPAEYSSFLKESGRTSGSSSSTQATLPTTLRAHSQPLPKTSSRHKELVNAVGRFISKDLLPVSAVEGVGFRSLMEITEPRFTVPSRNYFSQTVIPSLYLQERKRVETTLAQVEYCSFTTDLWTAKYQNRSYISISCHFIDEEWELHSYCLETRELPIEHTAQNIATELSQLLKDWNVGEKLCGSTTDNGRNIINAMEILGVLNFPCMGHTLQLAITKSFDLRAVSKMLARVRKLVKHFHKSSKATYKLAEKQQLLDVPQHKLKGDCVTRWGSTYTMLERLLEQQQAICAVLPESENRDVKLLMPSSEEFAVAEELTQILKTFHVAIEIVSGEKYPTIGIVHPLIHKLLSVTLKEAEGDSSLVKQIKAAVSLDLKERYQDDDIQKLMKIGMLLDPRFKKIPYLSEVERTAIWLQARDELVAIIKADQSQETEGSQSSHDRPHTGDSDPSPPQPKKRKLTRLLGDILETAGHGAAQTEEEIAEAELRRYESEPGETLDCQKPLQWWKVRSANYKYLSKLAKKILCHTATSVPSERIFSTAGNVVSQKRSCLSPENVNRLVFLYENMQ